MEATEAAVTKEDLEDLEDLEDTKGTNPMAMVEAILKEAMADRTPTPKDGTAKAKIGETMEAATTTILILVEMTGKEEKAIISSKIGALRTRPEMLTME